MPVNNLHELSSAGTLTSRFILTEQKKTSAGSVQVVLSSALIIYKEPQNWQKDT